MKVRTLAIMAATGLFAASMAYAGPMDITSDQSDDMMPIATSGTSGSSMNNDMSNPGGDMGAGNNGAPGASSSGNMGASSDNNTSSTPNLPSDSSTSNSNDDMSADTATGDDDY